MSKPLKRKVCSRCLVFRMANRFRRNGHHSTGLRSRCRECEASQRRQWQARYRQAHPEQIREKSRRQNLRYRSDPVASSRRRQAEERAQARWKVRDAIRPEQHLDLVERERRRYRHVSAQNRQDLHSAGLLALVQASRKFDPRASVPFRAFAHLKIRWGMRDEWDRLKRFQRESQYEEYEERLAA